MILPIMDEGQTYGALFNIFAGSGFIVLVDGAKSWTPQVLQIAASAPSLLNRSRRSYLLDSQNLNPTISQAVVSNITSAGVTISWFTDISSRGVVRYSEDPDFTTYTTVDDKRGEEYNGTSHYVKISELAPDSTYYFEIQSGDSIDNNDGAYHSFTTCNFSMGVNPRILKVYIYICDGTSSSADAFVFVTIQRDTNFSYPLSCLVGANGRWEVELRNLKMAASGMDFFWMTTDKIIITAKDKIDRELNVESEIQGGSLPQDCGDITMPKLAENDVTCDGVDDDCNGEEDEDYVGSGTTCGQGACARNGEMLCVNGQVVNSCQAGDPLAETDATCDDVDDNCDGQIDEGCHSVQVTVTKNPVEDGEIELILFSTDAASTVTKQKVTLNDWDTHTFSVPSGNYTIFAQTQAKGYIGDTVNITVTDNDVQETLTLAKKEDPSVSIIRQNVLNDNDFRLDLHFRFTNEDGDAQGWDDAGADLSVQLFTTTDDPDADGTPNDKENPTGIVLDRLVTSTGDVFAVQYFTGNILLGDLSAVPGNIMTQMADSFIVGIKGTINFGGGQT